jgi:hypothetical protein
VHQAVAQFRLAAGQQVGQHLPDRIPEGGQPGMK